MNRSAVMRPISLLGVGMLGVAGCITLKFLGVLPSNTCAIARGHVASVEQGLAGALARCERGLAEARSHMRRHPDDGPGCLRVASLETRRCELLALAACERQGHDPTEATDADQRDYLLWRQRYLRADPDGSLTRVTRAARAALRSRLDPPARRRALLLLADARAGLGDHAGEAAALVEAVRGEPDRAALWLRLAEAYGRAGRFSQAEATRGHALAVLGDRGVRRADGAGGRQRRPRDPPERVPHDGALVR